MRKILLTLFILLSAPSYLMAQNKSEEYFAKVPSRFFKPGLSPMQSIRFGYLGMPGNQWLKHSGELKLDLGRIKLSKRASVIISGAAWANFKTERRDLYKVNDEQAFERTNYFFATPALSAGVSYALFFPVFVNARVGAYKPWEGAYYKAYLPIQYSDQQGVQTMESELKYTEQGFGEIKKYLTLELYRPFKGKFKHDHPMGASVSYTYFLDNPEESRGAWNFGIYWHIKANK